MSVRVRRLQGGGVLVLLEHHVHEADEEDGRANQDGTVEHVNERGVVLTLKFTRVVNGDARSKH